MIKKLLLLTPLWFSVSACDPGQPESATALNGDGTVKGYAAPLTDAEYASLDPVTQYQVANKLLATLFRGVSVDTFFDLEQGLDTPVLKGSTHFLRDTRVRLATPLEVDARNEVDRYISGDPDALDINGAPEPLEPRYRFNDYKPKQMPLARIREFPISKDMFSQWMALHLTNTILFSPAEEIDSADIFDVQNLFRRLELAISKDSSVRAIVATHQRTVENWRRFRSPEDNTREMIEIYLGLFDRDEDVPRASQACRDLYLTDEADGYKLAYTDYPNDTPQLVLGQYVLNCGEFYDVVASHPLLIPRITSVLVDYFFEGRSSEDRTQIVESIAAAEPETFADIYTAILFSREYLLNTERPRSFEESFLGAASRIAWDAHPDIFYSMSTGKGSLSRTELAEVGWPSMSLKLGRLAGIPLDSLSFANYHKGLREELLLDRNRWRLALGVQEPESPWPELPEPLASDANEDEQIHYDEAMAQYQQDLASLGAAERTLYDQALEQWNEEMRVYRRVESLTLDELLDYLFLSFAERKASSLEKSELTRILELQGYFKNVDDEQVLKSYLKDDLAEIVLDYLSRLPEVYYFKAVKSEE